MTVPCRLMVGHCALNARIVVRIHTGKQFRMITNDWFYRTPPWWIKLFLLSFVWGDVLVLGPLVAGIIVVFIFDLRLGISVYLLLFFLRYFVEIFYWLGQQFGPRTYRPEDFGLKQLDNNAIYIIYQLMSMVMAIISGIILSMIV